MFITQMELQKLRISASGAMSEGEILTSLIREDQQCLSYEQAAKADAYYEGRHDVANHSFQTEHISETVTGEDGAQKEQVTTYVNPNRSNLHTANPFFWIHVEQKTFYVLGKEPSISVDESAVGGEEYSKALAKTTNAAFMNLLTEWATEASKGGKAWIKEYRDRTGRLCQAVIPRRNGIPVYDTEHDRELVEFIYHYEVDLHIGRGTTIKRTYVEWWTKNGVTYWFADGDSMFKPDPDRPGVQPHYWETTYVNGPDGVTQVLKSRVAKTWERFPFVELLNNKGGISDLTRYKDLIDAYDLIQSKGSCNALDFNEFFAILQGYGGETANAVVRKLRINQAVNITGQGGNIDLKQLDLAMGGRVDWLKLLRDAIHEFGMAVDIKSDTFGNAPSGVALKFQYTLLDLKANRLISHMKMALETHFWFVTQDINKTSGTQYDPGTIDVIFNKSMITNDVETVNMIAASTDIVPERLLMAAHPLVDDVDKAMAEMEKQRKRKAAEALNLMGSYGLPEDKPADDKSKDDAE